VWVCGFWGLLGLVFFFVFFFYGFWGGGWFLWFFFVGGGGLFLRVVLCGGLFVGNKRVLVG